MVELMFFVLTIFGGILIGIQAPINGTLGRSIGGLEAAFFSFFIGTLALTLIFILFGKGNIVGMFQVPKWQLIGGLLGSVYVTLMIFAVPKIGTAAALMASISGQIFVGLIIDHYGLWGSQKILFDWQRFVAVLLMVIALFLVFRSNTTV